MNKLQVLTLNYFKLSITSQNNTQSLRQNTQAYDPIIAMAK